MSSQTDFKKLVKVLRTLPEKLEKSVVAGAVRAGAAVVRDEVRNRVHKDTLELRKAIGVKKRRTKKTKVRYSVFIKKVELDNGKVSKNTKQYAYYLEYGTKNMSKKPFLRPSLDSVGQKPVTAAREYIKKTLPKKLKQLKAR